MKNTSDNATQKWLVEFASELRKIRSVVDELGDFGQTTMQVAKNIARINNAIEKTATELSFVSTAAELARYTELSTKLKTELEEVFKKREAFTAKLKPTSDQYIAASDEDIAAFIASMKEYKPNGLTKEDVRRAESPAGEAYCWYRLSLMSLPSDGEYLAEWLEDKATALLAKNAAEQNAQTPVPAVLVGGQAEQLAAAASSRKPPNKQGRENAARLVNEIYHSGELKTYAKRKGKKKPSRQLAIAYIRNDEIPSASKFYERANAIRSSVLTELAKSSDKADVQKAWNSILTIAKKIDPQKGTRQHTDTFLEEQAKRRHDNKPGVVPNIGDSSSRYKGW